MTHEEMEAVLESVKFYEYKFCVVRPTPGAPLYLQAKYTEPDIVTGKPELQSTRKWQLSEHMTKSEFVQTAFKCCITSMEHRTREHFRYQGHAVFGPHFDIDALVSLCKIRAFDYRSAA
jgi:hypothetical protein